jgi:hypothetical protein
MDAVITLSIALGLSVSAAFLTLFVFWRMGRWVEGVLLTLSCCIQAMRRLAELLIATGADSDFLVFIEGDFMLIAMTSLYIVGMALLLLWLMRLQAEIVNRGLEIQRLQNRAA